MMACKNASFSFFFSRLNGRSVKHSFRTSKKGDRQKVDKPRCQARARCPKDSLTRVPLRQRMLSSGSKPTGGFSIPERSRRFVFGSSEETLRRASKLDPKANERGVVRFAALDGSAVFHDWDTQRPSPVKTSFRKSQTILRSILGGANIRLYFPHSTALSSGFIRTA